MATLSQLQARLEVLYAARASGVLSLGEGTNRVQYRSLDEMTRAIGLVEQEISQLGGARVVRSLRLTSSKDL